MLMYKILIIFAALLYCADATGQSSSDVSDSTVTVNPYATFRNTTYRDTILFSRNKDSVVKWKKNKKYSQIRNTDSLLHEQQKLKLRPVTNTPSFAAGLFNSAFFKIILWLIVAAFVGFIVYRLFITNGIFKKEHIESLKEETDEQENSMTKNYDGLLKNAYSNNNFRMAMRYLFLQTLQRLHARELIIFAAEKTNSAYVNELPSVKRNEFASLTLYYEYTWYGNVAVEKETYDIVAKKFNDFINKI